MANRCAANGGRRRLKHNGGSHPIFTDYSFASDPSRGTPRSPRTPTPGAIFWVAIALWLQQFMAAPCDQARTAHPSNIAAAATSGTPVTSDSVDRSVIVDLSLNIVGGL